MDSKTKRFITIGDQAVRDWKQKIVSFLALFSTPRSVDTDYKQGVVAKYSNLNAVHIEKITNRFIIDIICDFIQIIFFLIAIK